MATTCSRPSSTGSSSPSSRSPPEPPRSEMSTDALPTYTAASPAKPSSDELRSRIPGWGVDLDPADRPSYPKLTDCRELTGAHWDFPERQPGGERRERSV